MVRTGARTSEEMGKAKAKTSWLQNILPKKKERRSDFRTNNYWNRTQTLSIQEAVFCADKNYGGFDEVLCIGRDKVEDDFIPDYLNANLWSITHQI